LCVESLIESQAEVTCRLGIMTSPAQPLPREVWIVGNLFLCEWCDVIHHFGELDAPELEAAHAQRLFAQDFGVDALKLPASDTSCGFVPMPLQGQS
jgi:hypothetical protein